MMASGIIDPTNLVGLALQNAASVASLLIATNVLLVEEPSPAAEPAGGLAM